MRDKIQKIRENALAEIDKAEGLEKLNDVRAAILGKKGELTAVLKGMKDVAPEDRPKVGQWVNETREAIVLFKFMKMEFLFVFLWLRRSSLRFLPQWDLKYTREQKLRMTTIISQPLTHHRIIRHVICRIHFIYHRSSCSVHRHQQDRYM